MLIDIIKDKYKVGCGKGLNYADSPGILNKLKKVTGLENELVPGVCFLYSGQVVAVDSKDRLVLITSETGPFALDRIIEEVIDPEYKVKTAGKFLGIVSENIDVVSVDNTDDFDSTLKIESSLFNLWKRRVTIFDEYKMSSPRKLCYTVPNNNSLPPVRLVFDEESRSVMYDSGELDEDMAEEIAMVVINFELERK